MKNIMESMQNKLVPISAKVGENRLLKAISNGFNMVMPIIIIGAIFSLLSTIQIGFWQNFIQSFGINNLFATVNKLTVDILAIYVAFSVAYSYMNDAGFKHDGINAGLLSILAFLILTPIVKIKDASYIGFDYLGSKGLFTSLLVAILVGFLYVFVLKKNWTIKMPEGVPPIVSKAFSALIPGFVIVTVFICISGIVTSLTGTNFTEWLYSIISAPLKSLSGSIVSYMILTLLASLFWFFGLHGGQITLPFSLMLFMAAGMENQAAFASGQEMHNIISTGLLSILMLGGIGNTIGLAIDMTLFSKSKQYKTLGKLAILPAIVNINEPIMFGFPIILNPIMFIPYFIVPQINFLIAYFAMKSGVVSLPRLAMGAMGTPLLINGWMICGISGLILEGLLAILSAIMYLPFFKVQDSIAYNNEKNTVVEE